MKKEKEETEEETYKLNMEWLEAVHRGGQLYVRPSKYRIIRWLLGQ